MSQKPFLPTSNRVGGMQRAVGRVQAKDSRKPAATAEERKKRLDSGRKAAKNLTQGTIRKNREK